MCSIETRAGWTRRRSGVAVLAIVSALATISPAALNAQTHDATGIVVDEQGEGLGGAMVVALAMPDSALAKWASTGGDGSFRLGPLAPGDYLLQVTLLGRQTIRNPFSIADADFAAGTIGLAVLAVEIEPLVVSVEHVPFINQRDTLSFNALAFEVRPNATVEDLLRRLPGIQVEADGTITAQGEDVQNVLVDGKEFFGSDATVATRNLPASAVERIDVYDKESDTAEFTGIADGEEERTINLALREEARQGYFGEMAGAFGAETANSESIGTLPGFPAPTDTRVPYDGRLSLNRFSSSTQFAVIGNAGNSGQAGFRGSNIGQGDRGGGGGGGGGQGLTESLGLGANFSQDFGEDTWLRSSYFFGKIDNIQNGTIDEQRLLGSAVSSELQGSSTDQSEDYNHRVDLNSQIEFADGHDVRLRGGFQASARNESSASLQNQTVGGAPLNNANTNFVSERDQLNANARLTWRKRLNESGRSLIAEGRLNYNDTDQLTDLTSTVESFTDPTLDRDLLQEQTSLGQTTNHSIRLSMTEPLGRGNVLEVFGERRSIDENQGKSIFDLEDGTPVFNPFLSSEFDRTYTYLRGGLRFSRNTESTRFVLGLQLQNSDLVGVVLDPEAEVAPISSGFTHLLPNADLRLQVNEGKTLRFSYNASTREPSMAEFQPFADNNDPLNVYVGNPDLDPEYSHRVRGEYRLFDQFSFVNLFTYASLNVTTNNIAQSRTIDQNGRQLISPLNSGTAWSTNGGINYGRPIRSLGIRVELDYRLSYGRESAFVNDVENQSRIVQNRIELSFDNRDKSRFEIEIGGALALNDVNYSLNERLNQNYINPRLFADGSVFLGPWTVSSEFSFQGYDSAVFGQDLDVTLWEASVTRLILGDRADLQLAAYDLLNQNQGITVTNTANLNRTSRVQTLGRHVMLRFNYHLGSQSMRGGRGGRGRDFRGR